MPKPSWHHFQVTYPTPERARIRVRSYSSGNRPSEVVFGVGEEEARRLADGGEAAVPELVIRHGIQPAAAGHLVRYLGEIGEALEQYERSGVRPGMIAFGRGPATGA